MRIFLKELRLRNSLLYWFGLFNIVVAIVCLFTMLVDKTQVLGINRWVKPLKFYASVGITVISLGWFMYHLHNKIKALWCSWLIVISMFFENGIILYQAYRHQTSHFNISTAQNAMLFSLMGIFILIFTLTVVYITVLFFRKNNWHISQSYLWGIRLGLLLFLFFSVEGGIMLRLLSHTVGGKDGGPGLPFINWSTRHGDLRIAHFMGIHALQFLPLLGYYAFKTKKQVQRFALTYFIVTMVLLTLALLGIPLIHIK